MADSPDGSVTASTYDHLGELTSVTDGAGDESTYDYDDQGNLAYAYNPDGSFAQYGYDQAGRPTAVTDYGAAPAGQAAPQLRSESFGYDLNGDQTSATDWDGTTTTSSYNAAGELTGQVKPVSSVRVDLHQLRVRRGREPDVGHLRQRQRHVDDVQSVEPARSR